MGSTPKWNTRMPKAIFTPVKLSGETIGHAEISDDGMVISIELDNSNVGLSLREVLEIGFADGISVKPHYIPAINEETIDFYVDGEKLFTKTNITQEEQ